MHSYIVALGLRLCGSQYISYTYMWTCYLFITLQCVTVVNLLHHTVGGIPSITAFEKNGLKVVFFFERSPSYLYSCHCYHPHDYKLHFLTHDWVNSYSRQLYPRYIVHVKQCLVCMQHRLLCVFGTRPCSLSLLLSLDVWVSEKYKGLPLVAHECCSWSCSSLPFTVMISAQLGLATVRVSCTSFLHCRSFRCRWLLGQATPSLPTAVTLSLIWRTLVTFALNLHFIIPFT